MSKWIWVLGAGAGALMLSGAGRKDDGKTDEPSPSGTPPAGGGEGGNTPEPEPPWVPEPYESYARGPYTVDLTGLSSGIRWRVFETTTRPAVETGRDESKLGSGLGADDEEARIAANAFIDALGTLPVEPFPLPPTPTPDPPDGLGGGVAPPPPTPGGLGGMAHFPLAPTPPQMQAHGLNVYDGCTRLEVDDIVSWIAWAEPWVRARLASMEPKPMVRALLGIAFPSCNWDLEVIGVAGGNRLHDQLLLVEHKYFVPARAGVAWPQASPWEPLPLERAVAELLGVQAPAIAPPEFAFRGYHVELDQVGEGQWVWRAWKRGKDGGGAELGGGPSGTWQAAATGAKVSIAQAGG